MFLCVARNFAELSALVHDRRVADKAAYLDRIYRDYGMFAPRRCQPSVKKPRTEQLPDEPIPPSFPRVRGGRRRWRRGARARVRADDDHDQWGHRVLSARLAARVEVRQDAPEKS